MQSKILEKILTENKESLEEMISIVKDNSVFKRVMGDIKEQYFIDDAVHGISHNERVVLHACYIGIKEGLKDNELDNLLRAALYHDIGRKLIPKGTKGIGKQHGIESARILEQNSDELLSEKSKEDIDVVRALCIAHSQDDDKIEELLREHGISLNDETLKLIKILKDADALDRVRLPHSRLDEKLLRTEIAKGMVGLSKELYKEYSNIDYDLLNKKNSSENNISTDIFGIDNFNVVSDDEYYYVFRAINSDNHSDIENGTQRIRTDRERWEEQNGRSSRFAQNSQITAEEIISHCIAYNGNSKETNCISLSSNANIAIDYGEKSINEYIMVKIPKNSNEGFIEAGKFLLEYLENAVNSAIDELDKDSELYKQLEKMNIQSGKEIIESVASTFSKVKSEGKYTGKNVLKDKSSLRSRFENKQIFSEEQQRKFIEIIGKLTVLEMHGEIKSLIKDTKDNSLYLKTMSAIFSNTEILHYNAMESENFIPISRELVDLFALIQQVGDKDRNSEQIKVLESRVLELAKNGYKIEEENGKLVLTNGNDIFDISQIDKKRLNAENSNDIQTDIEYIYKLTGGKIPYEKAKLYIEFAHKLCEAKLKAQEYSKMLGIIFNDDNLEEIINRIAEEGFAINKDIIRRQDGKGIQISESVNIDGNKGLKNTLSQREQEKIVELIKEMLPQELQQFIEQKNNNNLIETLVTSNESKTENEYYAEAIIDSLDMNKIYRNNTSRDKSLKDDERQKILEMLKNADCKKLYNAFINASVSSENVSEYIINILADGGYKGFSFEELSHQDNLNDIILLNVQNKNLKGHVYASTMETLRGIADNDNKIEGTQINLRDYQQETIENVDRIFADGKRFAGVVLPTGAGKSFVAMTEMLKKQNGNIIYIAPQQEILSQIQRHILKNIVNVEVLTTDEIERLKKEQNVTNFNKLKLPDGKILPTQASEYVKKAFPHLKLLCYQGLSAKKDEELTDEERKEKDNEEKELKEVLKNADADLIVFDELHRSGAKTWKNVVEQLIEANEKADILGITATPIRDVDHVDMMRELATMTNTYTEEELNTKQYLGYEMYLTDAIQRGLVVEPKLFSFDFMLRDTDEYQEIVEMIAIEKDENKKKELIEIKQQIDNLISGELEITEHIKNSISQKENEAIGKIIKDTIQKKDGRYIVFLPQHTANDGLSETEYFEQQELKIREILKEIDAEPEISRLSSKDSKAENHRAITDFENSTSKHLKIMLAINKLNEGVHVEGINGEIMYRKINDGSTILYLQQLGRVIYSLDPNKPVSEDEIPIVYDIYNNYLVQDLNRTVNQTTPKSDLQRLQEIIEWMDKHDYENLDINSEDINEARKAITLKKIQNKYKKYKDGINNPRLSKSDIYEIEQILELANSINLFDKDLGERIIPPGESKLSEVQLFKVTATQKNFLELYKKANKVRGNVERHENRPTAKLNDIMNILATLNSNDIFIDNNLIQYGDTLSDVISKCPEEFRQILLEELYMYDEDYPIGKEYNFAKKSFRDSSIWKYFEDADVKKLYACGIFEDIDENYMNEFEQDSNKRERINKPVLANDFIVLGPKNLKNLNVKTGTYYDENGYDINGYNAKGITKDFELIDTAKILLHNQIIYKDTLIGENTTINDLLEQAGYEDYPTRKKLCLELGVNIGENIGQSICFLRKAYYTSGNHQENGRMFGLHADDLYELAQLGIIPNDKILSTGEIQIGAFKGMIIPEYAKIYGQLEEERKLKVQQERERKQEEKKKKLEEEERKKQEPFDGITTGIKLLQKGIIESGKEIPESATIEELLKIKGFTEDTDIEKICTELGLDKTERIGEKLKYLTDLYNSGSVRKDNDDGKRFTKFQSNLLEMMQLGIFEVNERGKVLKGPFHDQYIDSIKSEYDKLQEEKSKIKEGTIEEKINYQFKGLNTAVTLLKIGIMHEGETIDKDATVRDVLLSHRFKDEDIKRICLKYKIDEEEKLGDEIDLLKTEYRAPTTQGKILFERNRDKIIEMVQLGIIPLASISKHKNYIQKGPLKNELTLKLKETVERLQDIEIFIFNENERENFKKDVLEAQRIMKILKEKGYTSQNKDYKEALIQYNKIARLYRTVLNERKKMTSLERKSEFMERKSNILSQYTDNALSDKYCSRLLTKIMELAKMTPEEYEENKKNEAENKKEKILEKSIKELGLSARSFDCLKRAGILTIKDLVNKTESDIMKVRNLGKKSLDEVSAKLYALGLDFADEEEKRQEERKKITHEQRKARKQGLKENDPEWIAKREKQTEIFLNLKEQAKKLAMGGDKEMCEYIMTSKTTIDELIDFAKKQKMSPDIIRGLNKQKPRYVAFKRPFKKEEYLAQTTLMIDGEYIKPTEKDVDMCLAYLKSNGYYICNKTVKDTIRGFLKGEIDITIDTEKVKEQIKENAEIIAENEEQIKDTLVEVIIGQQKQIKSQEEIKQDLKGQRRDDDG